MRLSTLAALLIVTTVLLSGCSQPSLAAMEDRSQGYYGRMAQARFLAAPTHQDAAVDAVSSSPLSAPTLGGVRPTPPVQPFAKPVLANDTGAWLWPVQGKLIGAYGKQGEGVANTGITIAAPAGTQVRASAAGKVAYVGKDVPNLGAMVILRHANGDLTSYAHLGRMDVTAGQPVAKGQGLGVVGQSGGVEQPQLHFAIRVGETTIDPLTRLSSQWAMLQ